MYKYLLLLLCVAIVFASKEKFRITNGEQVGQIVNKTVVNSGEFPFIVFLNIAQRESRYINFSRCAGSIIRADVVLTAAHCVTNKRVDDITVFAGIIHTALPQNNLQIVRARRYVVHEDFDFSHAPADSDIALLFLDKVLNITDHVKVINLPTVDDYIIGSYSTAIGWGKTETGNNPRWLQKTELFLIPNTLCQTFSDEYTRNRYIPKQKLTENMICAMNQYKSTVCKGDSGGPLIYNNAIIGITSWTWGLKYLPFDKITCDSYYPALFVKVSSYVNWINENLR